MYDIKVMKKFGKILLAVSTVAFLAAGCSSKAPSAESQPPASSISPRGSGQETVISYRGQDGKTALVILKENYQAETKQFSGVGEFVESINGIKPDSAHFWKFFINGEAAKLGAGSFVTKNSDVLEWHIAEVNGAE